MSRESSIGYDQEFSSRQQSYTDDEIVTPSQSPSQEYEELESSHEEAVMNQSGKSDTSFENVSGSSEPGFVFGEEDGLVRSTGRTPRAGEPTRVATPPAIIFDSITGKLESINFKSIAQISEDIKAAMAAIFQGNGSWDTIPSGLSIITGQNGKGKSVLLEYIKKCLTTNGAVEPGQRLLTEDEVLYIPANNDFLSKYTLGNSKDVRYTPDRKQDWYPAVSKWCKKGPGYENTLPDGFARAVVNTLMYNSDGPYTEEMIDKAGRITNDLSLTNLKLNAPISLLEYIFKAHIKKQDSFEKDAESVPGASRLFEYYELLSPEDLSSLLLSPNMLFQEFAKKFENPDFKQKFLAHYTESEAGISPWEELNSILREYKFKYTVDFDCAPNARPDGYKIIFKKGNHSITPEKLSSGELLILQLFAWKYYSTFLSEYTAYNPTTSIKIMLLDEFDSHFDPKLCELFLDIIKNEFVKDGIQVIITTHRPDTLALVGNSNPNETNIFTLRNKDGISTLEPTHKVLALSRLSTNLQQLMGLQIKVYVEALDDQKFYELIYANLMQYRQMLRDSNPTELLKLKEVKTLSDTADLSMRYPMSFYPASDKDNFSGGYTAVIKMVHHGNDILGIRGSLYPPSPINNLFRQYNIDTPLGIIDMDDGKHAQQDRIIILKRHSVENFICDPMLLNSVFGKYHQNNTFITDNIEEELNLFFNYMAEYVFSEYKKHMITQPVKELFNQEILRLCQAGPETLLKPTDRLSEEQCVDLQNKLIDIILQRDKDSIALEIRIKDILDSDGNKYIVTIPRGTSSTQQNATKDSGTNLRDSIKNLLALEDLVKNNNSPCAIKILMPDNSIILVEYPEWFIKGRGHDIYDLFKFCLGDFKNDLFKALYSNLQQKEPSIAIPLDLVEIFTDANKQIVTQVRNEIKPGTTKKPWITKALSTPYENYDPSSLYFEDGFNGLLGDYYLHCELSLP